MSIKDIATNNGRMSEVARTCGTIGINLLVFLDHTIVY
jgi:hypothetical protein